MKLIDADELKAIYVPSEIEGFEKMMVPVKVVLQNIDDMPTVDAVPVVRCRNCRFSQRINDWVYYCYVFNVDKILNQYCDMGERKDGGDEKADRT